MGFTRTSSSRLTWVPRLLTGHQRGLRLRGASCLRSTCRCDSWQPAIALARGAMRSQSSMFKEMVGSANHKRGQDPCMALHPPRTGVQQHLIGRCVHGIRRHRIGSRRAAVGMRQWSRKCCCSRHADASRSLSQASWSLCQWTAASGFAVDTAWNIQCMGRLHHSHSAGNSDAGGQQNILPAEAPTPQCCPPHHRLDPGPPPPGLPPSLPRRRQAAACGREEAAVVWMHAAAGMLCAARRLSWASVVTVPVRCSLISDN
jgi:hypothetical protein